MPLLARSAGCLSDLLDDEPDAEKLAALRAAEGIGASARLRGRPLVAALIGRNPREVGTQAEIPGRQDKQLEIEATITGKPEKAERALSIEDGHYFNARLPRGLWRRVTGVVIRIVLDPRERHDFVKLGDLSDNVRIKRGGPFIHLKAYEIDGEVLRTCSANFSTSGESAQDNDLIVVREPAAAGKFEAHFERMWEAAQPMIEFGPAIEALEPK